MTKATTIRLAPTLKKAVEKRAKALGMDFSEVARILFTSFAAGKIQITVTQYPDNYAAMIQTERERLLHKGKLRKWR